MRKRGRPKGTRQQHELARIKALYRSHGFTGLRFLARVSKQNNRRIIIEPADPDTASVVGQQSVLMGTTPPHHGGAM